MKKVLSLLLAFVFLQTQSWALSGGPLVAGGPGSSLTGTYAGVLVPQLAPAVGASTSIGLFTLATPDTGLATGTITVFVNGAAFNGTVTGVMDPKEGKFSGVVDAQSTFQVTIFVPVSTVVNGVTQTTFQAQNFDVFAQGSMDAEAFQDDNVNLFTTSASTPTRLQGTATLDIFFQIANDGTPVVTQTTVFDLDGFKQSDT
jgi:hypothetical protein